MQVLTLLVILGPDVLVLFVVYCSIFLFEENFVLNNEDILNDDLVFILAILSFSFNHA